MTSILAARPGYRSQCRRVITKMDHCGTQSGRNRCVTQHQPPHRRSRCFALLPPLCFRLTCSTRAYIQPRWNDAQQRHHQQHRPAGGRHLDRRSIERMHRRAVTAICVNQPMIGSCKQTTRRCSPPSAASSAKRSAPPAPAYPQTHAPSADKPPRSSPTSPATAAPPRQSPAPTTSAFSPSRNPSIFVAMLSPTGFESRPSVIRANPATAPPATRTTPANTAIASVAPRLSSPVRTKSSWCGKVLRSKRQRARKDHRRRPQVEHPLDRVHRHLRAQRQPDPPRHQVRPRQVRQPPKQRHRRKPDELRSQQRPRRDLLRRRNKHRPPHRPQPVRRIDQCNPGNRCATLTQRNCCQNIAQSKWTLVAKQHNDHHQRTTTTEPEELHPASSSLSLRLRVRAGLLCLSHQGHLFSPVELADHPRHILPRLAVRRNAVIPVHRPRPRVISRQRQRQLS